MLGENPNPRIDFIKEVKKMWKLYLKYLKFCRKHNFKAYIPSKYAFLSSYFNLHNMELTPYTDTFKLMLKKLRENEGYCPCALKKIEATKCACLACSKSTNWECGLYEKIGDDSHQDS